MVLQVWETYIAHRHDFLLLYLLYYPYPLPVGYVQDLSDTIHSFIDAASQLTLPTFMETAQDSPHPQV